MSLYDTLEGWDEPVLPVKRSNQRMKFAMVDFVGGVKRILVT